MAGHIVKVVIENTHPPVWRRIILPELITLADLHRILQCVFQWNDYHMHGFESLKSKNMRIENEDEDEISTEMFFRLENGLRYVYDFGDDWNHKIIYEKEDSNYDARYATVIKYKGDSFQEDSGGVWYAQTAEETRIPFNMQEINEQLRKMNCLIHLDVEKETKLASDLINSQINDVVSKLSPQGQQEFWAEWRKIEEEMEQDSEASQSVLGSRVMKWWKRSDRQIIAKGSTDKNTVQLLSDGNLQTIQDYCKYIGIPEREDVRLGAQDVWNQWVLHPDYLAIVYVWEELQSILEFFRLPNGVYSKKPDDHAIAIALSLGLLDMREERIDRRNYLMICPTKDAQKLLASLTDAEWKQACERSQKMGEKIADLLELYSLIEIPAFCGMYRRYYDASAKDEDIQRLLYFGGTFRKEIITGVQANGVPFVAETYLESEEIIQLLDKGNTGDLGYRIFSKEERKRAKEGFSCLYPAWQDYSGFVDLLYEVDEEELENWMQTDYYDVISGCSTRTLWENLLEEEDFDNLYDYTVFWKIFLEIYLTTGLPQYKGYSRREYVTKKEIPLLQICDDIDEATGDVIISEENNSVRKAHLYQLPAELQLRVYQILKNESNVYQERELERILKDMQDGNCEIEFIYATILFNEGRLQEAKELFSGIRKDYPEDSTIKQFLRVIREGLQEQQNMRQLEKEAFAWKNANLVIANAQAESAAWTNSTTYKREQPKVGRNDPCPCGSGKKYKKCCGK